MEWFWVLLSDLMITVIAYLIFPVIYKIKTGGVADKKAHILSLVNAIVVFIIFTIIKVVLRNYESASVLVAFTYYWIARAIMSKKEEPNQLDEKEETTSQVETTSTEKKEIVEERVEKLGKFEEILPKKYIHKEKIQEEKKEVIGIGSIVTIYDEEFGEETYKIVSAKSGKDENEIHISAPLAQALVGHTVGEEITVAEQKEYKVKIIKVEGTKMQIPENHSKRTDRNIYLVFQGKQAGNEITGGYLFALCKENISHYRRLKKLKKGDIVIHCAAQHILAVSEVTKECRVEKRPAAHYLPHDLKDASGWMVDVKCHRLEYALKISYYKDIIIGLQGNTQGKGYPFNYKGNGNQGYLFNLNRVLALYFLKKVMEVNPSVRELNYMQDIINEISVSKLKVLHALS